jgi:predicted Zn-dependent protease
MGSRMMAVVLAACVLNSVLSAVAQESPVEVYMGRARAQDAAGRQDLAILNWRQALLLSPRLPEILAALARDYAQQGDSVNAKIYLERRHQVQPQGSLAPKQVEAGDSQSLLSKAAQFAQQRRFPEALALYRKALGPNPTSGEWAAAYYETEAAIPSELPQAITSLRKLVSDYPAIPKYRLALARALTYSPSSRLEGMRMLADFQGLPEDMEAARIAWHNAILWDPSSAAAQETGAAYLQRYPDNNLAEKLRSARTHPAAYDASAHLAEGYRALQAGELDTAAKAFTKALTEPGQAGRARLGLGYVAMKQQDFAAAVKNFAQAKSFGVKSTELETAYADARYWDLMQQATQAEAGKDDATAAADYTRAIELEADRPEATEALAGLWLKQQDGQKALPLLREEVAKNKSRAAAWQALANAELLLGRYHQILGDQAAMPAIVLAKLQDDASYLTLVASAQFAVGQRTEAEQTIAQIDGLASADMAAKVAVRSRLAQLAMQQQDNDDAIKLSLSAVHLDAANLDGWRMLVAAEHAAGLDTSAWHVMEQLPEPVKTQLMNDPAFLLQAAAIYQQQHEYETASMMLHHAQRLAGNDAQSLFLAELQLASLEQAMGHTERAYAAYRKLIQEAPDRTEPWVGLVSTLHAANRDAEALRVMQEVPSELIWKLRDDASFLQTLASVYTGKGDTLRAMECLRRIRQNAQQQGTPVPFAVEAQYAWLQLNAGDEIGLSASLSSLSTATGLSQAEHKQVEDLWVTRSVRQAETSFQDGKQQEALKLVDAARQVYPDNPELRREMSALLIRRGHPEEAYRLYAQLDWSHASDADFANAATAASAAHEHKAADLLLQRGLQQYPESRVLLTQAAQMAQQNGKIKQAEVLWKAIDKLNAPQPAELGIFALTAPDTQRTAMERLAQMFPSIPGENTPAWETQGASARPDRADDLLDQPQREREAAVEPARPLVSDTPRTSAPTRSAALSSDPVPVPATGEEDAAPAVSVARNAAWKDAPAPDSEPLALTPDDALDSKLDDQPVLAPALSARQPSAPQPLPLPKAQSRQPFVGSSSDDDRILASSESAEEDRGASSPSYLSIPSSSWPSSEPSAPSSVALATVPGASGNDGLGALQAQLSPWVGGGIEVTNRSGQPGFDQLSRTDYDLEASTVVGDTARLSVIAHPVMLETGTPSTTPIYGFGTTGTAVPTTLSASGVGGEVQLATAHVQASVGTTPSTFLVQNVIGSLTVAPTSSFSLHFTREPVTQTMLSYAGMQDPATGQIWGGVVATGGGVHVSSGDAQSGVYGSADFQELTGRNVTTNSHFEGNVGGYWKAYENNLGTLTVGANLTGEHFAKTLQYFTFGQGGYFSPDAYLLFSVPVTWQSKPMHNFSYSVSAALGSQTYEQGPILAGSFLVANAAQTNSSSANYNLGARAAYRITPTWYLEGYASVNNSNDYQQNTVGFSLRRMIQPHSASDSLAPTGLFDPHQPIRPLLIP